MGTQQAEKGIALLRIFSGLWLLRTASGPLVWLPFPWVSDAWVRQTADTLARHSLDHPAHWLRYLIQQLLLPQVEAYAGLSNTLLLLVGIALALGAYTSIAAIIALVLALFQGWLTYYLGEIPLGFSAQQSLILVVVLFGRGGQVWALDPMLPKRRKKRIFTS